MEIYTQVTYSFEALSQAVDVSSFPSDDELVQPRIDFNFTKYNAISLKMKVRLSVEPPYIDIIQYTSRKQQQCHFRLLGTKSRTESAMMEFICIEGKITSSHGCSLKLPGYFSSDYCNRKCGPTQTNGLL